MAPDELRAKARNYRRKAGQQTDWYFIAAFNMLANEFEKLAREADTEGCSRTSNRGRTNELQ